MIIERSESIKTLAKALLAVQAAVGGVTRDSTNIHYKSRYASLEAVVAAIRPHCLEQGIVVTQAAGSPDEAGRVPIQTMLIHAETGEWLGATVALPMVKQDAQGFGSAMTYGCRYSLISLFNIPPTDDDGEEAVRPASERKSSYRAKKDGDFDGIAAEVNAITNLDDLVAWRTANSAKIGRWPAQWLQSFNEEIYEPKQAELRNSVVATAVVGAIQNFRRTEARLADADSAALLHSLVNMMNASSVNRAQLKS